MSVVKGFPSKERNLRLSDQDVHVTAEPIREKQIGQSILAHQFVRSVASDAVEASSTVNAIVATAHVAKVGDVIEFTSGALSGQEVKVQAVSANLITLSESLASAPVAAVTFDILRHKYPVVDASGNFATSPIVTGPLQYTRDAVTTLVSEDTGTPSNSRPLPVKLVGVAGDINITAGDLNIAMSHVNDSVKIGDGTDLVLVTAAGEMNVLATAQPGVDIGDVTINNASIAVTGPLTDAELRAVAVPVSGTFFQATQPVSATNLDTRDLTSVSDSISAVQSGTWDITDISGTVSLPTGASTEATLSTLNGKVPANLTVTSTRLLVDGSGVTQPVSGTVTVTYLASTAFVRNDYSSINVTTGAYVELVASTASQYRKLQIFDSSGQTLKIAFGAAASEVDKLLVFPGGNDVIEVNLPASTRVSIRAVSATASVGEICINFIG